MNTKSRWEVYQGTANRTHRDGLRVTLSGRKILMLNKAAFDALGGPPAAELRYDESTRTIGLFPRDIRIPNAFPIRRKSGGKVKKYNYMLIHASPFCKHHEINPTRTLLFTNVDLDNDGTLLLELNTAVNIGRGLR